MKFKSNCFAIFNSLKNMRISSFFLLLYTTIFYFITTQTTDETPDLFSNVFPQNLFLIKLKIKITRLPYLYLIVFVILSTCCVGHAVRGIVGYSDPQNKIRF